MNKYQACLYSFECICYGDFKYGYEIPKFCHFWIFCEIFDLSSSINNRSQINGHVPVVMKTMMEIYIDLSMIKLSKYTFARESTVHNHVPIHEMLSKSIINSNPGVQMETHKTHFHTRINCVYSFVSFHNSRNVSTKLSFNLVDIPYSGAKYSHHSAIQNGIDIMKIMASQNSILLLRRSN